MRTGARHDGTLVAREARIVADPAEQRVIDVYRARADAAATTVNRSRDAAGIVYLALAAALGLPELVQLRRLLGALGR